ncbi:hypothetical protein [Celeribacter baekdonensis]|uniref:hypothetical protein n=1 Tax=Celeribacter baekdonensis TaxID=875171 RepID=UPI003A8FC29B
MKPNFALNLSHDGIVLLHRASAGWHHMGEVALDAPDMAKDLSDLRRTATAVSAAGLATKLVIPNSQVLYRNLPDPGGSDTARKAAIRASLEGATPYALSDLVWDWVATSGTLQIAVVAKETLEEAESFATEHRFNPVSFVALPEADAYSGEPFFGRAKAADDLVGAKTRIEPDVEAIRILAHREVEPDPVPEPAPEPAPTPVPVTAPAASAAPNSTSLVDLDEPQKAETATDVPPENGEQADHIEPPALTQEPDPSVPKPQPEDMTAPEGLEAKDTPTDTPDTPDDAKNAASEAPSSFQSRRVLSTTKTDDPDALSVAPRLSAQPSRVLADVRKAPEVTSAQQLPDVEAPDGSNTPVPQTLADPAPHGPAPIAVHVPVTSGDMPLAPEDNAPKPKPAKLRQTGPLPEPPPMPAPLPAPKRPTPAPVSDKPGKAAATLGKLKTLSVRAAQKAKPVVAKAKTAKAKTELANPVKPSTKGFSTTDVIAAPAPDGRLDDTTMMPLSDRAAGLDSVDNTRDETEAMTVFGARRRNREAARKPRHLGFILTGALVALLLLIGLIAGLLPSPDTAETPTETSAAQPLSDAPNVSNTVLADAAPLPEADVAVETDAADEEEELTPELLEEASRPAPLGAETETSEADLAKLTADYAATGIWPLAPDAGDGTVVEDSADDVYVASIDPGIQSQDAGALVDVARHQGDLPPRATTTPAPFGTRYDFDDAGFIRATPEGTVTPDGIVVYAGRPAIVPGARPGSAVNEAVETALNPAQAAADDPVRLALAGFRPKLRPEELQEANEKANLGGITRAQLGGFRPKFRPASAQEQAAQEAIVAGANAPAPTAPVVVASLIPKERPKDFSKLAAAAAAASAAAAIATDEGTTKASAAATVTARVPDSKIPSNAPTTVARAATVKNAINLRALNLMGVYGSSSDRRALVRLPSGRFAKVKIGDKIDGGRVQSIGSDSLTYVKNGRSVTLEVAG